MARSSTSPPSGSGGEEINLWSYMQKKNENERENYQNMKDEKL
jgi:hypothetical protein